MLTRLLLAACVLGLGIACSKSSPTAPTPSGPSLACPADIFLEVVEEPTVQVHYSPPSPSGGTAPVTVECSLPSGSDVGAAETVVTCTATDSGSRTAQCSFRVTVTRVPRLRGTKIVAFGDSITAGEVSPPVPMSTVRYMDPANSYPAQLQQMLRERYTAQEIVVINEGVPGEQVLQTGEGRIDDVADHHEPDVLIVLQGVNGLKEDNADDISEGLRRGVRRAVRQGVPLVIVSTILPGVDGRRKPPPFDAVLELNEEIREWAGAEGAVLVDSYAHFIAEKDLLIGEDGLHPTPAGYTRLAELFRDAIQANFELPPPPPPPSEPPPGDPLPGDPPAGDPPAESAGAARTTSSGPGRAGRRW